MKQMGRIWRHVCQSLSIIILAGALWMPAFTAPPAMADTSPVVLHAGQTIYAGETVALSLPGSLLPGMTVTQIAINEGPAGGVTYSGTTIQSPTVLNGSNTTVVFTIPKNFSLPVGTQVSFLVMPISYTSVEYTWGGFLPVGNMPEVPFGALLPAALAVMGGTLWARGRTQRKHVADKF